MHDDFLLHSLCEVGLILCKTVASKNLVSNIGSLFCAVASVAPEFLAHEDWLELSQDLSDNGKVTDLIYVAK